jgi:hydroxypyruvate reductase
MLVGSNADAVAGLLQACAEAGIRVRATRRMVGEARTVGARLAAEADRALSAGEALVFGGETTVTVRGAGRGGRCQELVVAAADALERGGRRAIVGCLGTDGRDGPNGAAGAVAAVVPGTTRWQMTAPTALANNDTFPLLEEAGALVHTGPTHTNVMDIGVLVMIS